MKDGINAVFFLCLADCLACLCCHCEPFAVFHALSLRAVVDGAAISCFFDKITLKIPPCVCST